MEFEENVRIRVGKFYVDELTLDFREVFVREGTDRKRRTRNGNGPFRFQSGSFRVQSGP
jgi:hypothetical protein